LSVGGLLLATGVGIGYTAVLAAFEAAALSNLVTPHMLELVNSGDVAKFISSLISDGGGGGSPADNGLPMPPILQTP
jgi:hypothetical protein